MAAGRTYDASTFGVEKELYNVKTGYRMTGGANLYVTDLSAQEKVPQLAPVEVSADETNAWIKIAKVVRNCKVYANAADNNTLAKVKIEKGSFVKVGDKLLYGNGLYGEIKAIVTTNADYDEVEFTAAIEADIAKGAILYPVTVTPANPATTNVTTGHEAYVFEAMVHDATPLTEMKIAKGHDLADPGEGTITLKLAGNDIVVSNVAVGDGVAYDTLTITGIAYSVPLGAKLTWETTAAVPNAAAIAPERVATHLVYAPVSVETGATCTLLGQAFEIQEDDLQIPVTDADKASLGDRFMFV